MSRKTPSFEQMVDYVGRHKRDQKYNVHYNLYARKSEEIKKEFIKNGEHVKTRKNGVYMYHEVLSLSKGCKLEKEKQKELLKEIVSEYIKARSSKSMVYAVLHDEPNRYLHYHIIISSNEKDSSKKVRIAKEKLKQIKRETEKYVLEKYPELEQTKTIQTRNTKKKMSQNGHEMERRTKKPPPQRERVTEALREVFKTSKNKQEFFELLRKHNLEILPPKGKHIRFKNLETGQNHRVATLGLETEFRQMSERIELETVKAKTGKQEQEKKHKKQQEKQYKEAQGQREEVRKSGKEQEKKQTQEKEPGVSRSTEAKSRTCEEIREELARADREELRIKREQREEHRKQKDKTKAKTKK
jgi:hypothetical protein